MRNANLKLLLILGILVVLVAAAGILFSDPFTRPDSGPTPITITATEGLIIPDPQNPQVWNVPSDTYFLLINADGFNYPSVPLLTTGEYTFTQPDGSYNILHVTPTSIHMKSSDCSTQDCINQGTVSKDAMLFRPLGGQIICLPHKLIVELKPDEQTNHIIILEETSP